MLGNADDAVNEVVTPEVDNSNQAASSENNSAQLADSSEKKTAGSPVKVCISYSCVTFVQKLFH